MRGSIFSQASAERELSDIYGNVETVARIFYSFVALTLVGLLAGIFIVFSTNNLMAVAILSIAILPVLVSLQLLRMRRFEAAAAFLGILLILMNTILSTLGLGIHSVNNFAFPVILIVASLVTKKRTMFFLTLLIVLCLGWLVFGELSGSFEPGVLVRSVAGDFFSTSLIVVITAVMVRQLTGSMFTGFLRLQKEMEERKLVEEDLRQREAILEAVTFAAEQFLRTPDWRRNIDHVLERLGKTIHATHAYLFEDHLNAKGEAVSSMRYEWTADGFPSDLGGPYFQESLIHQEGFEDQVEKMRMGEVRSGSSTTFNPIEKEIMNEIGVKSILEVPVFVNGREWGAIGFDDFVLERQWSPAEVDALKIAANVLGAAIKRQLDEDALKHELAERQRAEAEANAIFDNSPVGIYRSSVDGKMIQANKALVQFNGYADKTEFLLAVKDIASEWYVDPARREEFKLELEMHGQVKNFESEVYRHKTRERVWISENAQVVCDANGQVLYYEGTVEDITPRKNAEAERESLFQELADKNAELEQFTYTVSHDLKSPLVTIDGFLGYLEEDAASGNIERLRADTQRIHDAVRRMQKLLNELLELARVGRVMNHLQLNPFSELVDEAVNIVQGRLEQRGVTMIVQSDLPPVYGDRQRLVEVLQNLIENATKYMGNREDPQIEIAQEGTENGMAVFSVRDNGMGIDPDHHEQIFGLFNKLDPKSEGTGIGLSLVKRIVEFHGGRIWVESKPGEGSVFYFTLPCSARMADEPITDSVI